VSGPNWSKPRSTRHEPNPLEKTVWIDIPKDCRIHGEFTGDYAIHVVFGDPR
jgi:hypothetical protein